MNTLPFELDQKWLNNWLEALISGGHYTNHLGKRVYLHPQESLNSGERGYLADLLNLLFTDLLEYGKDNRKHSFEFSQNTHYQTLIGFMKSNWSRKLIELLETAIANNTQPWEVGTVFTPMALVQTMVKNSIDNWVRSQLGNENDLKTGNDLIQEIKLEKLNLELLKRIRTKLHDVKIIDNACGTGRFLEECANYLFDLDKMLRQFLGVHKANNDQAKWILQNNIHGMDINPLACNFARLRLNMWYVGKQITRKSRQIPQVPTHLYVGDTLVGGKTRDKVEELIDHNSYDGLTEQLDKHWHELFFEVFNRENPGFDIIVGNPPYISSSKMDASLGPKYKKFVNSLYNVPLSADLSVYFVLQSLSMLRSNGWHSYLITSKWMRAKYGKSIRDMIAKKTTIKDIIDITSLGIFDVATVDVIIYNLVNTPPSDNSLYYYKINSIKPLEFKKMESLWQNQLATDPWTFASAIEREILDYLSSSCESLADLGIEIFRGITTGRDQVFVIDEQIKQQLIETYHDSGLIIHPTYSGKHISPYRLSWNGLYIIFTQRNIDINRFPGIKQYLEQFEEILAPKPKSVKISHPWKGRKSGNYQWYEIQDTTAYAGYFSMPKIVATKAASIPSFTIDYLEGYPRNTVYIFNNASKSLLAQLNSTVAQFYIQRQFAKLGTNTEPKVYELLSLPVNQLPPVLKGVLDAISNYLLLLYHLQDTEVYELIVLFSRLQNLLVLELYFMELLFEEGIYLKKGFKWMIITKEYLDFVEVDNVIKDLQFNVNQSTRELKVRSIVDTIMKVGESIKSKQLCEKIHHDLSQHRYIAYILQYDKI